MTVLPGVENRRQASASRRSLTSARRRWRRPSNECVLMNLQTAILHRRRRVTAVCSDEVRRASGGAHYARMA